MKVKIYADFHEAYNAIIDVHFDKEIELVIDVEILKFLRPIPENTIRIFSTIEPDSRYNEIVLANQSCFDYLITADPALLHLPQARLMVGYPAWVRPNKSMDKLYGVSAVFSARNSFPGHPLRHELWRRQNEITIPKFFYAGLKNQMSNVDYSKELVLNPDHFAKEATMRTMYHIAIDCFEKDNLFTEKLTDPLISFSVPIYWGSRNIDKYFDTRGIIQVNSVDEIIQVCNNLPHEHDHKTVLAMYENYDRAVEISDYPNQLKRTINKLLNEST